MTRVLILKTGVNWLLRAYLQERADPAVRFSLLTNSEFTEHPFENVHRYPAGRPLSVEHVDPAVVEDIRRQRYDRVVVLMAIKVPAMYRHVFDFAATLGIAEREVYFKHAPDGTYDDRFRAGFWSEDERHNSWYAQAFLDKIGLTAASRPLILDVGCGRGAFTDLFYRLGYRSTVGVDLSAVGLADARRTNPRLWLCRCDAYRLPFRPRTFDCLFLRAFPGVQLDLEPLVEFGRQCRALLKRGGHLVQVQPSINMTGEPDGDPLTVRYLSEPILSDYFRKLGYRESVTYFTDRATLQALGAAALTGEQTARLARRALTDIRFYLTATIARRDD